MSSFYIGQRVKKVRGATQIGLTAIVDGFVSDPCYPDFSMVVRPEAAYMTVNGEQRPAGVKVNTIPDCWEPIVPEGLESLEEINALYEPQGVAA